MTYLGPPKTQSNGSLQIGPEPTEPFRYYLVSPYNKQLLDKLSPNVEKGYHGPPGMHFADARGVLPKRWTFGPDLLNYVVQACQSTLRATPTVNRLTVCRPAREAILDPLRSRPYQLDFAERCLADGGRAALFEMGLGKTPAALLALEAAGCKRVLIISPSKVCYDTKEQIRKFLPDAVVWPRKRNYSKGEHPSEAATHVVLSMDRLHYVLESDAFKEWMILCDGIIIDECHNFKSYKSGRSGELGEVLSLAPRAIRIPMSGTPIPNLAGDIYQPFHLAWPWVFGKPSSFKDRYLEQGLNKGGFRVYGGLHPRYADELRERIAGVSTRATKEEWGYLLPSFTLFRIEVEATVSEKSYHSQADFDEELAELQAPKVEATVKHALAVIDNEAPQKLAIVTYHREAARSIARQLRRKLYPGEEAAIGSTQKPRVIHVMGDYADNGIEGQTVSFDRAIDLAASEEETTILVVTMDSIREGLNRLVCFSRFIYAELYYRPASVSQSMARFHRLTSRAPVVGDVMFAPGSIDERIFAVLQTKLGDIDKLVGSSTAEKSLSNMEGDGSDWMEALREAF